jgi:hypothetical protein
MSVKRIRAREFVPNQFGESARHLLHPARVKFAIGQGEHPEGLTELGVCAEPCPD